ncbi:uncharacterized protein N7498_008969 [Penicillium cinerascens]|uniref:Uncharacterized protein n=1 Tax=Penicillium cinerascens TaxID=70096 RepID=A0A9W9JGC3_9EURO|nr:uncharacterized protein N7498_008969 [Penicillium cinerascens]KAJ5195531.1 hypothetical protein N7498_008969 [Penicillium cinerascens]
MNLILRKQEAILMAPTGTAADNIGENTYHTSLTWYLHQPIATDGNECSCPKPPDPKDRYDCGRGTAPTSFAAYGS